MDMPHEEPAHRARSYGLRIGDLPPGPNNAITDVPGVLVGHFTFIEGDGLLKPGEGPVRTGVTVVLPHSRDPFREKVPAAVHTINGFGMVTGFEYVRTTGRLESPVALTNTLSVGLVLDALTSYAIRSNPEIGVTTGTVHPVVGETHDGWLNDIQGRHVRQEHVWEAIDSASGGAVAEGVVGAGTGTVAFEWKGGIGTSSRVLPAEQGSYTLGALVQTNYGGAQDLHVLGIPVGKRLPDPRNQMLESKPGDGSVMVVLATDAPLTARQLQRLCVRTAAGLARTGSIIGHGSGDFVIAFSTAYSFAHWPGEATIMLPRLVDEARVLGILFRAVVESVEEAVLNSLVAARTVTGRDGHVAQALPIQLVVEILLDMGVLP